MTSNISIIEHAHKSLALTVYDTKWIPSSARFVMLGAHARQTGAMQVYGLDHGELKLQGECEKPFAFKCGTFGASPVEQRHFATGDFNGNVAMWDLEDTSAPVFMVEKAHGAIVNCIDGAGGVGCERGAPEIVTGSRDGAVHVWDPRQKDAPVASLVPGEGEAPRDCWSVAFGNSFNDEERCVLAGYDNGDVMLFDMRMNAIRWETNVANGVCGVEFDRKDIDMNKFAVTTLESQFHVYDARTQHPTEGFASLTEKAHNSTVWGAKHVPQNRDVFMTLGGNGSLNLYKYKYPAQRRIQDEETKESRGVAGSVDLLTKLEVSTQPIASLDWSREKAGLAVCGSFDQTIRVLVVSGLNTV